MSSGCANHYTTAHTHNWYINQYETDMRALPFIWMGKTYCGRVEISVDRYKKEQINLNSKISHLTYALKMCF